MVYLPRMRFFPYEDLLVPPSVLGEGKERGSILRWTPPPGVCLTGLVCEACKMRDLSYALYQYNQLATSIIYLNGGGKYSKFL